MRFSRHICIVGGWVGLLLCPGRAQGQEVTVDGQVEIVRTTKKSLGEPKAENRANVAVWLTPVESGAVIAPARPAQLIQKNKSFEPHSLVVQVGSKVEFPNKDPFFHNVFSLFNGKKFDLGSYEAGSGNSARFDRAGISFLFCNIHPEMSAIVISVPTLFFGVSNAAVKIVIPGVPAGRYRQHVWHERSLPEDLAKLEKEVVVSEASHTLEPIRVVESITSDVAHKNLYGKDYVPPSSSPGYPHP